MSVRKIALLGCYVPRQCGIATFTTDLSQSVSELDSTVSVDVVAMSDRADYDYPPQVVFEIREESVNDYAAAAEFINRRDYDVLSVQHEYGIFGGEAGKYLMGLIRAVKAPIVTTLHTVLSDPSVEQKKVMDELLRISARVVVMSKKAVGFLLDVHHTPHEKIDLIPHGIPSIADSDGAAFRESLNVDGPMILTFGLLSPGKGIEYVIDAMPRIVSEYPGAVYFVVGATHPHVISKHGEQYREGLKSQIERLGIVKNVRFVDRFVSLQELVKYLAATDIYVTPYLNPHQITSGTLAYSIGAGKAVISTPYWYAEELLADGRGLLVPFRDADAIADAVLAVERDPVMEMEMGRKAVLYGKEMLWPEVARSYMRSFDLAKDNQGGSRQILKSNSSTAFEGQEAHETLPELKFTHLFDLTDDTGIIQHATFTVPNRSEGYCVDDNARALLLTALVESREPLSRDLSLVQGRYLSFVLDAFNRDNGWFRNFMSYGRDWLEEAGSEDSHGRSIWALGNMVHRCRNRGRREAARRLFDLASPALLATTSLRTWAYAVLGASQYLKSYPQEDSVHEMRLTMASRIWRQYRLNWSVEWPWFEDRLTYANARVAQALILAGDEIGNDAMRDSGLDALHWLMKKQEGPDSVFAPIGSDGFFVRGGERAYFDQQPIEAWAAVSACLSAYSVDGDECWHRYALKAFRWFLGENMLGKRLFDRVTGGCHDGLHEDRVNENQGAESTLAYLCALSELRAVGSASRMTNTISGVPKLL